MASERQEPTPAELRVLMAEVDALQQRIQDIRLRLRSSEETRHISYQLGTAAAHASQASDALSSAAGDLARTRTARDPKLCSVPWGVCPEHGNTLQATGGRAWCTASLCPREWGYDRLSNPCTEPATYKITDQKGAVALFCDGHAMDASKNLEGATTTPLEPEAEDGGHD